MKTEHTEKQYYQDQFGKLDPENSKVKLWSENAETHAMNLSGFEAINAFERFIRKAKGYTPKVCVIEVKFLGPTNNLGSRVKITCSDLRHVNNGKPSSKTFPVNYEHNNILDQAENVLNSVGFSIIGVNEQAESYLIITEWDSEKLAKFFEVSLD